MKPRPKKSSDDKGAPAWMMTYGDLMTLLLCFFVLIVTFSTIKEVEFKKAMASFRRAVSFFRTEPYSKFSPVPNMGDSDYQELPEVPTRTPTGVLGHDSMLQVAEELRARVEHLGIAGLLLVYENRREIRLYIPEGVLFEPEEARLKGAESERFLQRVTALVVDLPYRLQVEGHTDDTPIRTEQFPSNWELSAARSLAVLHFLQQEGVAGRRLSAVGYGPHKPRADNASLEGRTRNRRVEIVILDSKPEDFEPYIEQTNAR